MNEEERALMADEILESTEAFQIVACLLGGPRSAEQIAGAAGLDRKLVDHVAATMADLGIVSSSRSRLSIRWKPFTALLVEAAIGMDTEISIMIDEYERSGGAGFERWTTRADRRVKTFHRDLASDPDFTDLIRSYLDLLAGQILADDPQLHETTLLDAAVAFESLLTKVGPGVLRKRSRRSPRLLASLRGWAGHARTVSMPGEIALARALADRGLLEE